MIVWDNRSMGAVVPSENPVDDLSRQGWASAVHTALRKPHEP